MESTVRRLFLGSLLVAGTLAKRRAWGQSEDSGGDAQIVEQASLVAAGKRIEVYQHDVRVDPGFLAIAESAVERIEALTGRPLDTATMGPKIRIYVSAAIRISHVWKGYQHPRDPRAIVFLNPRVYHAALSGADATYAHELSHLITWRFYSHSLREGLADYLALQVLPGAGIGPNRPGDAPPSTFSAEVASFIGTALPPPRWLSFDPVRRREYYAASRRFVQHLIDRKDMATFLKLYDAADPQSEMQRLYGAGRGALLTEAGI